MKVKKHCSKCGFPFIYMNDACYCTDALGENMKTKSKYPTHLTITKHYGPEVSTITKEHYTKFNEHPEDRISRDREYIQRLQRHIDYVYDALERDLRLKDNVGWLFDYIFNEDDNNIEFEEYLAKYDVRYDELVK